MSKIRIHELARELGVSSRELLYVSQNLGFSVDSHANTLSRSEANDIKGIINGVASAAFHQKKVAKSQNVKLKPEIIGGQESLMLVNMGVHNIRVSENYQLGFDSMVKVLAALLSDLKQTVRMDSATVSWGDLYFLRADRSSPFFGSVELEYGGDVEFPSQRQKGFLGDIMSSAIWLNEDWKRPFEKLSQVLGLIRNPEGDYRNQLEGDLRSLEARGRIEGLDEWEITTGTVGRNIYIAPKERFQIEHSESAKAQKK